MTTSLTNSGANAFAIKFYDKDLQKYRYKILAVKSNIASVTASPTSILGYINEHTGISSDEAQAELQGYISSNDTNGINEWVKKYLPTACFLQLDESDPKYNDIKNAVAASNRNNYYESSDSDYDLSEKDKVFGSLQASFGLDAVEGGSGSGGEKSYDSKKIGANKRWAPTDRAVTKSTIPAYDQENFPLSKYWVTEDKNDGNNIVVTPATDGNLPSGLQDQTALTNPDYGKTGTSEKITDETAPVTMITVGNLTTEENAVIDMSYANTVGGEDSYAMQGEQQQRLSGQIDVEYSTEDEASVADDLLTKTVMINRELYVENASLGEGTTFRLGVYGGDRAPIGTGSIVTYRYTDTVYLQNATANDGGKNLYIELGWVPELRENPTSGSWHNNGNTIQPLLGIYEGAENFNVQGRSSLADGIWHQYKIIPEIESEENYFNGADGGPGQGTLWYLSGYSYIDTGFAAESGQNVAAHSTVMNNFVKANNDSLFRRPELLHGERLAQDKEAAAEGTDPELRGELRESIWAEAWHGKFDAKAAYGRQASQSYNGYQVGYDKLLHKSLYGGRVYTGFYVSKMEGSSHTLGGGSGDQDSLGVGMYTSWVGEKGDFLDLGLHAFKVEDEYHFTANTGDGTIGDVKGDYDTWAYGLGAKYGHRHALGSGWYLEPSASFFMGHVDESKYQLTNGLGVEEKGYDTAVGRLNLKAGRQMGDRGSLYAGLSWGREFAGGQKAYQTFGSKTYGEQVQVTGREPLETVGGQDSWWEWSVGGRWRFSSNGVVNVDFSRAVGSDLGNQWSINGGLDFSWGGFGEGKAGEAKGEGKEKGAEPGFANAHGPTVSIGQAPRVGRVQLPHMEQKADAMAEAGTAETAVAGEDDGRVTADDTANISGSISGDSGSFELGGLTVEANRPDWEKSLSPGQVSVIYTKDFEGEQKDLAALLQRVPGMYINRVSGMGHYAVARVRGSSASQVNVYVDGVQMNLNGESAVNLAAIPVDNVERIEVYRGYIPARFGSAPLGGVINIVTKKPREGHGHISQGMKSYGGYNATYEYSMPLGGGSLLATYSRDIWQGDFPYYYFDKDRNSYSSSQNKEFYRKSNGYQNNNALLKWQDGHWTVKGIYKKLHEELPSNLTSLSQFHTNQATPPIDELEGYSASEQDIEYKEFSVGRRDTTGNLDWGWSVDYLHSKKSFFNSGQYKYCIDYPNIHALKDQTPGSIWTEYVSDKWSGNLNMAFKAGRNHLLEFNADISRETMDCDGNNWHWTQEMIDKQGSSKLLRKMLREYNIREYHFSLQDSITLNDDGDFKLTPVLRAEKVEMETFGGDDEKWQYSGGLALQKQINDHWNFKTTWGTYHRHPNFYEIFGDGGYTGPSPGMREYYGIPGVTLWETGKQFDFSLNWQGKVAGADTDTIVTWYQRDAKNQLAQVMPMGGNGIKAQYVNMDKVDVHGIELSHNMRWRRLALNLAATWQKSDSTVRPYTGSWYPPWGQTATPEWVVSARLDYTFPGDKLSVFAEYNYTDRYLTNSIGNDFMFYGINAYSTLDLGLKYKFDRNWKLSAGVNDVFDKGYDVVAYRAFGSQSAKGDTRFSTIPCPLPGRMYYATVECSF